MLERIWKKRNTPPFLVRLVQPLWKSIWRFIRELEIDLPEEPSNITLGNIPERCPTIA
jgi:hypothetical protein